MLAHHQAQLIIGSVDKLWIDDFGLLVDATLGESPFMSEHILPMIQQGKLKAFSVGFVMTGTPTFNSARNASVIDSVHLLEISVVSIPSNESTIFELDTTALRSSRHLGKQNGLTLVMERKGTK